MVFGDQLDHKDVVVLGDHPDIMVFRVHEDVMVLRDQLDHED
jgi:hypothetical protein